MDDSDKNPNIIAESLSESREEITEVGAYQEQFRICLTAMDPDATAVALRTLEDIISRSSTATPSADTLDFFLTHTVELTGSASDRVKYYALAVSAQWSRHLTEDQLHIVGENAIEVLDHPKQALRTQALDVCHSFVTIGWEPRIAPFTELKPFLRTDEYLLTSKALRVIDKVVTYHPEAADRILLPVITCLTLNNCSSGATRVLETVHEHNPDALVSYLPKIIRKLNSSPQPDEVASFLRTISTDSRVLPILEEHMHMIGKHLDSENGGVRTALTGVTYKIAQRNPAAVQSQIPAIIDRVTDDRDGVGKTALKTLVIVADDYPDAVSDALPEAEGALKRKHAPSKTQACKLIGKLGTTAHLQLLRDQLDHPHPDVRTAAEAAIESLSGASTVDL